MSLLAFQAPTNDRVPTPSRPRDVAARVGCHDLSGGGSSSFGGGVMTHEWKAGDRAMVEIVGTGETGVTKRPWAHLKDGGQSVFTEALRPLPTPDPHQVLRDAVVEAAEREANRLLSWPDFALHPRSLNMINAVKALRAALAPPDPVEELRKAFNQMKIVIPGGMGLDTLANVTKRVERAVQALEAARKVP